MSHEHTSPEPENAAEEQTGGGRRPSACSASSGGLLVTCQDCGTRYEMGNGQLAAAEKRGHYYHLGHCPKCDRKTWSEPFPVRPMTRAEIAAAFHSPQNVHVDAQIPASRDSESITD